MLTTEQANVMAQAASEIRTLRRQNELLDAQVAVVEVFRAALLGRPNGGFMSEDVAWRLDVLLKHDAESKRPASHPGFGGSAGDT